MAKIITVYDTSRQRFILADMAYIRWLKISESLAKLGHQVDIATNEFMGCRENEQVSMTRRLRRISLSEARWKDYDVIKTLFHAGFDALEKCGGANHPFIISKLGSVVGPRDMKGVYFYGKRRKELCSIQKRIDKTSKFITVISKPAKDLWEDCLGVKDNILVVPGAVDSVIPPETFNPYPRGSGLKCVFFGNVYSENSQPEAHRVVIDKLNKLGKLLKLYDIQLYMAGVGDVSRLDKKYVNCLGIVSYERTWNYFYHANAGIVVIAGSFQHNNESSKIYHYLRAGLPVVSEKGFPNDNVVEESKLGYVVENGNLELMAKKISEAVYKKDWDRQYAIRYILNNHTWDKRVKVYSEIISKNFG